MEESALNLADLVPKETAFTLSTMPGQTFILCRWTLRVRAWAIAKYTSQGIDEIFKNMKIDEIADMAYFMLKDKGPFNNDKDTFLDAVSSIQDQLNIIKALLGAVGIGEPEMKKFTDSLDKKKVNPPAPEPATKSPSKSKPKIGAKSSTP